MDFRRCFSVLSYRDNDYRWVSLLYFYLSVYFINVFNLLANLLRFNFLIYFNFLIHLLLKYKIKVKYKYIVSIYSRLALRIKCSVENIKINVRQTLEKCRQFTRCWILCHTKYGTFICAVNARLMPISLVMTDKSH